MAALAFGNSFLPPKGFDRDLGLEWTPEEAVRAVISDDQEVARFLRGLEMSSLLIAYSLDDPNRAKPEIFGLQFVDYDEYEMNCVLGSQFISPLLDSEQAVYVKENLGPIALGRYEDLF